MDTGQIYLYVGFVTETNNNGHDVFPLLDRIGKRYFNMIRNYYLDATSEQGLSSLDLY